MRICILSAFVVATLLGSSFAFAGATARAVAKEEKALERGKALPFGELGKAVPSMPAVIVDLVGCHILDYRERLTAVGHTLAVRVRNQLSFELIKTWPYFEAFEREFVTIPAGILPNRVRISSFEASQYPVTRLLWNEIMGEMPFHVPAAERALWGNCLYCPVTYVNWEEMDGSPAEIQEFLKRLNQKTGGLSCIYDLPTDHQLEYLHRADPTGLSRDRYSAGVTNANVNDYVVHRGNSDTGFGHQIQPVGLKKPNAFGVDILGNVWTMSKDLYSSERPALGRSARGGSWTNRVDDAEVDFSRQAVAGYRFNNMSFSLVRRCETR